MTGRFRPEAEISVIVFRTRLTQISEGVIKAQVGTDRRLRVYICGITSDPVCYLNIHEMMRNPSSKGNEPGRCEVVGRTKTCRKVKFCISVERDVEDTA